MSKPKKKPAPRMIEQIPTGIMRPFICHIAVEDIPVAAMAHIGVPPDLIGRLLGMTDGEELDGMENRVRRVEGALLNAIQEHGGAGGAFIVKRIRAGTWENPPVKGWTIAASIFLVCVLSVAGWFIWNLEDGTARTRAESTQFLASLEAVPDLEFSPLADIPVVNERDRTLTSRRTYACRSDYTEVCQLFYGVDSCPPGWTEPDEGMCPAE